MFDDLHSHKNGKTVWKHRSFYVVFPLSMRNCNWLDGVFIKFAKMTVFTDGSLLTRAVWFYSLVITDASMLEKDENFLQ